MYKRQAHDAREGLPRLLVKPLLPVVVVNEDVAIGVFPTFAIKYEGGREREFLVELVFIAHANFVRAHGTGMPVVRGQSAADFQKDVLRGEWQAEARGEQRQEAKEGTLHGEFIIGGVGEIHGLLFLPTNLTNLHETFSMKSMAT